MRGHRGMRIFVALVVLGAAAVFAGSASSFGVCQVQLRVDVFGGGHHWALQGALNTGKTATLRAVESSCASLDHIAGRRVGSSGALLAPHSCAGATCLWMIRSRAMTAIDFQAYARAHSGRLVHSNIVRVAWGGVHENTWTGTWHVDGSGYSGNYVLTQTGRTVTGTCNWLGGCRDTGALSADLSTWTGTSTPNDRSLHPSDFSFTMAGDGQSFTGGGTTSTGTGWRETADCTAGPCLTNE